MIVATAAAVLAAALPGQCNQLEFGTFTPREVRCVIRRVWEPVLVAPATRVAKCESRLDPLAYNRGSGASGVYQFLGSTWRGRWNPHRRSSVFNTVANVRAARVLYRLQGWRPWSCTPY